MLKITLFLPLLGFMFITSCDSTEGSSAVEKITTNNAEKNKDSNTNKPADKGVANFAGLRSGKDKNAVISFASSNERFAQNAKPFSQPVLQISLKAWKNERVSCQVLIWANASLSGFKLTVSDDSADKSFTNSTIHFGFLKNVAANNSAGMCGSIPKNLPQINVPDFISNNASESLAAGEFKAIWVTIHVPANASEGVHTIYLQPDAKEDHNLAKLALSINVNNNVLPNVSNWKFHLNLWQYPLRVAKYYNVKPWSPEHFAALKPTMQQLANAGQKAITASFFWDNFNNDNYGYDNLMVKITGTSYSNAQFDFTNFDNWVEFMMSLGIKDEIDCFGMYTFNNKFEYYLTNPANKNTVIKPITLASDDYQKFWTALLKAFAQHVKQKGWMDKVVLFFDERPPKKVIQIATFIKKIDPEFKIGYSGAYDASLNAMLYNFTIPSYLKIDKDALLKRKQANEITTFYNTCYEKKPNLFTFSSPAEAAFMGWYAFANGYEGYVRYAFDMWEKNSATDTRSVIVPSGDKFIIYPQSYSSVRFEKLVEGIEDYEKLSLLTAMLNKQHRETELQKINSLLIQFKIDNTKNISDYSALMDKADRVLNSF